MEQNVKNGESFTFKFKVKVNDDVNGQRIDKCSKSKIMVKMST